MHCSSASRCETTTFTPNAYQWTRPMIRCMLWHNYKLQLPSKHKAAGPTDGLHTVVGPSTMEPVGLCSTVLIGHSRPDDFWVGISSTIAGTNMHSQVVYNWNYDTWKASNLEETSHKSHCKLPQTLPPWQRFLFIIWLETYTCLLNLFFWGVGGE